MPLRYRVVRRLLRIWFAAVFRKVRLLGAEDEAGSSATLLLVCQPPRILDVLLLVASFDRQLHCLLHPATLSGLARQFLAWSLGMIPDTHSGGARSQAAIDLCRELLESEETVVVFASPQAKDGSPSDQLISVARMALEVEPRPPVAAESAILPVHLLVPFARLSEALIHFGEPVFPQDFLPLPRGPLDPQIAELALELSRVCRVNPFALRQHDLVQVLDDLAEILRSNLADEWGSRPNWKQTVEGFTLSRFVEGWAEQTNCLDPDRLVTLREALDAYREARRRWSLRVIQIENAEWIRSTSRRTLACVESALGLPVACYGFLNHVPACFLISVTGLWQKLRKQARPREWAASALIFLTCYAAAVALAHHWFGRSAAGYYAVTLPASGLYLWRYAWLWRHRTRLLVQDLFAPADESRLHRMRRGLTAQVEAARNAYADTLGVAR